jgi:hypothetical protein
MSVTPATLEAKLRKITVESRQIVSKTLISTNKLSIVVYTCGPSYWKA